MKNALVLGAGGFIGHHMVNRLKEEGYWVRGVDIKKPSFSKTSADEFISIDLTSEGAFEALLDIDGKPFNEIYQYAADMGGAGYIFSGENDANVMTNSCLINLNLLKNQVRINNQSGVNITKIFYSSSACIYPEHNQNDPTNPNCEESTAYPANPDSEYGWEKLFSERLFFSYQRNYGINVKVARFHNIFGPEGTFEGGKEKVPAAICRKVAMGTDEIEVWGDGLQTRSFLYVDECIKATRKLMDSDFSGPVNIGSEEMVSINQLVEMVLDIANKKMKIKHIDGPLGVRGRTSDNKLLQSKLDWEYTMSLKTGLEKTYSWISDQINNQ
jgi:nucleoside-diphosphate-sugar epimerase